MNTDLLEVEEALRYKGYYYDTHNGQRTKVELGKGCIGFIRVVDQKHGRFISPLFNSPQYIDPLYVTGDGEVILSNKCMGRLVAGCKSLEEYNRNHRPDNPSHLTVQRIASAELFDKNGENVKSLTIAKGPYSKMNPLVREALYEMANDGVVWDIPIVTNRLMSDGCYRETDHGIESHIVQLGDGCRGYMLISVGASERFVAPIYSVFEPIRALYMEDHKVYCSEKPIPGSCEIKADYNSIVRYNSMHYENNEHKLPVLRITYVRMFNTGGLVESEIRFTNER